MAVATGGLFIAGQTYFLVPAKLQAYLSGLWACFEKIPGSQRRYYAGDPEQVREFAVVRDALAACQRPVFLDVTWWTLAGSLLPLTLHLLGADVRGGAASDLAALDPGQAVTTSLLLIAGLVVTSAWFLPVTYRVLAEPRRRAMPAVVAACVVAVTAWFSAWYAFRDVDVPEIWRPFFRYGLPPGGDGYATWSYWTGVTFPALDGLTTNPLTLPGLTLLWLVPILAAGTPRPGVPLVIGAAGGLLVIAAGGALPFMARAAVPASIRFAEATGGSWSFPSVYWHTYLWLAVIAQAVVAAVTAVRVRGWRPVPVLLAVSLTGLLAAVGVVVTFTAARCTDLFGQGPGRCALAVGAGLPGDLHVIAVRGMVVAVPTALLAATIATLVKRLRGRTAPPAAFVRPTPAVLIVLAVISVSYFAAAAVHLPEVVRLWLYWGGGPGADQGYIYLTGP